MEEPFFKKLVMVGDGCVGKSCLLHVFTGDEFCPDYLPYGYVSFERLAKDMNIGNTDVSQRLLICLLM